MELRPTYGGSELAALGRVAPNLWIGPAALAYAVSTRAPDPAALPPDQPEDAFDGLNAGLGLYPERDTRDSGLEPTSGTLLRVTGDAPLYALAQYDARGYQKGRYRDELELGVG